MWSLIRMYLLGRLLGGARGAGPRAGGRKGCGCFSLIIILAIIALAFYLFSNYSGDTRPAW